MSIIEELKAEKYRLGDLQALRYDRNDPLFGENYLPNLYFALGAGRRSAFRRENLQALFCGMNDLSLPSILHYLSSQKLVVIGKWEGEVFRTGGVCWLTAIMGTKEKSAFGAYGFLRWTWGTEDQLWMAFVGLAKLFGDADLVQMHGQRYADNHLTARFMANFGFRDLATVPKMIARGDKLEPCVVSTCSRDQFEEALSRKILEFSE